MTKTVNPRRGRLPERRLGLWSLAAFLFGAFPFFNVADMQESVW